MYLRFEENENAGFVDDRVFTERSEARVVTHVLRRRQGQDVWCPVTGMVDGKRLVSALGRKVEDSGEGICYLIYGGVWGLRLKEPTCQHAWSLEDPHQWGEGFLLLPADGQDVRFEDEST